MSLRDEQGSIAIELTPEYAMQLERNSEAFTAWAGTRVIACAGYLHFWPGRAQVWAMISGDIRYYGPIIHRHVKRYILAHPVDRLECIIDPNFDASVRWALRLGFQYEGTMRRYFKNRDMDMYVWESE